MKDEIVVLNYKSSGQTKVTADQIETMIPADKWDELAKNDSAPFFSVESIQYPAIGNTHMYGVPGTYDESYFQELENACKKKPIPGSNDGHSNSSKPHNDLFTVGVKVVSNGDGTGTAYFKNYIPPTDWQGNSNAGLIRDSKLGLLNFSLVSHPKYQIEQTANGVEYHIIGTNGGDRNDAVEEGAMDQTVNSRENLDFSLLRSMINNNKITLDNADGNIIQNGKVSRPVLRQIVSRADCENKSEYSELISMIDKTKNGGRAVELKEAVDMIGVAVKNGQAVFADIAKNAGCEKFVRNEQDDKNAEMVKAINALNLGDKPVETIAKIIAENKSNSEAAVKNKIVAVYGVEEKEINGVKTKNAAYSYAYGKLAGKNGTELDEAMNALKTDDVMKAIRGNQADPFMQIVTTENAQPEEAETTYNGIPVVKIGGK